ncbi:MAG: ADOP family duplicated permease [Bryobacteraceae bacterium]
MIRSLRRAATRLWSSLTRQSDSALREELELHIAMQTEDNIRMGMSPQDAARTARLKFGGFEAAKELYRDQRGVPFLDMLGQDLRYALRGMRRSPGFTALAVLSLGIGIGANTAIFSVVNGVLLRPLTYSEPDRLFAVREVIINNGVTSTPPANPLHVQEWKKRCPSLQSVSAARMTVFSLFAGGEAEQLAGAQVSPAFFDTVGVHPQMGRTFGDDEAERGRDNVVLITDPLWRRRFGADPAIIGKTILLSGQSYQVAGVLPAHLRFPASGGLEPYSTVRREPEIYQPLVYVRGEMRPMGNFNYAAMARLKPGASPERAVAEINTVQAQFPKMAGENVTLQARLVPVQDLMVGKVRLELWTLLGAVGAVLLIVCVNLANLQVARMTARRRESAIRAALGASRGRQVRQVLTESWLLSALGGAFGIALAFAAVRYLVLVAPADLPRLDQIRVDGGVLAFAVFVSMATGLLSGLVPAIMLSRNDPQAALKSGSHTVSAGAGSLRTRHALIGSEVAVSAALLIVAGLLTSSFIRLLRVDKGFETHRVLTFGVALMSSKYSKQQERQRFYERLLARLQSAPAVLSAALVTALPTRGETWIDPISVEGDSRPIYQRPLPNNRTISPDYFRTMGIPIRRGRSFDERDRNGLAGVISEKLAERLWPGEDPIGKRFIHFNGKPATVVGVVADVRATLTKEPVMIAYHPFWQGAPYGVSVVLRTAGDPLALAPVVRAAVREEDIELPIPEIKTLDQVVDASIEQRRFHTVMVLIFAGSALLVASLGIYGVVAFSVARRRTELGVRIALGARPADLLFLVVRQGMSPVVLGLVGGVAIALGLGNLIRSLLFSVQPADPATIAIVVALLAATALLACLVPARAAAASDPARTLRFE